MKQKMDIPKNMQDANKTVFANLIVNNHSHFQTGHVDFNEERGFVILMRFENGEDFNGNYNVSEITFLLINAFNNLPDKKYFTIHSVELTNIQEEHYAAGMVNFNIKIKEVEDDINPVFSLTETIVFEANEFIDFHILIEGDDGSGNIIWKLRNDTQPGVRNTGGHLCKGKTIYSKQ